MGTSQRSGTPPADTGLLLRARKIWTGTRPAPNATWMHIADGKVQAFGGPDTVPSHAARTLDLSDRHVLPGFADAHTHLSVGAWLAHLCDGRAWRSAADALVAIREHSGTGPAHEWLLAGGVDSEAWQDPTVPTGDELDVVGGGRPVLLVDVSLHRGVLSHEGMRRCGIHARYPDPHGDIEKSKAGKPTGRICEQAFGRALATALRELSASRSEAGVSSLLDAAAANHLRLGITRAHEPGVGAAVADQLESLRRRAPLRLSWSMTSPKGMFDPVESTEVLAGASFGEGAPSVKVFLDGAHRCAVRITARAAPGVLRRVAAAAIRRDRRALRAILGQPARVRGASIATPRYLRFDDAFLADKVATLVEAGARVRMHAVGNLAVEQAARVLRATGTQEAGVEHALLLHPAAAELLASTGAIVSAQPGFIDQYGPLFATTGIESALHAVPLRYLSDTGIKFAITSDHPCGPLDPLHNLRAAVTRQASGTAFVPSEAISAEMALAAATSGSAAAAGFPGEGALLVGAHADFVVCTGDPTEVTSQIEATWIGGQQAWPQ